NAINLGGGASLGIGGANDLSLSGIIGGTGGLNFGGTGMLSLNGANTFGGGFGAQRRRRFESRQCGCVGHGR
ncbi:hypothetical protein JTP67_33310, partial [Streptomyces sp. S12]|nr:hypothetical protein [Streptomyces sp. S12]